MITRKMLTVSDFTQSDNVTSPAILSPVLSYTVPRGMLLFVDPSQPIFANVQAKYSYTLQAGDISGNDVTITLPHKVSYVTSGDKDVIAIYDPGTTDEKVYGEVSASDPTRKTITATFTASPVEGKVVDVYYSIDDAKFILSVAAPSVSSVTVRTLLEGNLGVLNATDPTNVYTLNRLKIQRIVPAIEDYEIQLRVKSDASIKFDMPESYFELPVVFYSFDVAGEILATLGISAKEPDSIKKMVDAYFRNS